MLWLQGDPRGDPKLQLVVTSPRSHPFSPTDLCGRNRWLLLIMAELATWVGVTVDPPAWLLLFHLRSTVECRCSFHMALALNGPGCSSSWAVSRFQAESCNHNTPAISEPHPSRLKYADPQTQPEYTKPILPALNIESSSLSHSSQSILLHRQDEQTFGLLMLMLSTFFTQAPCLITSHQQCFQCQRESR
jgi:hypothetical protein